MLISSTKPMLALFHHGYLRLSMNEFDNDDNNLITHLTNQFFQKKDSKYQDTKEDTTWTMEQFNDYVNKEVAPQKNLPQNWVLNEFTKKMHQIMTQVLHSIRYKIQRKVGYFGIYGYDFMIDEDMKAWLIEINVNPAITCNTDTLNKAIPPAIEEGLKISIECFEKLKQNKKLLPLTQMKNYCIIFNEATLPSQRPNFEKSPTATGIRRSMSNSPNQALKNTSAKLTSQQLQLQQPSQNRNLSPTGNNVLQSTYPPPQNKSNVFLISHNSNNSLSKTKTDLQKMESSVQRTLLSQQTTKSSSSASKAEFNSKLQFTNSLNIQQQQISQTLTTPHPTIQYSFGHPALKVKSPPSLTSLELKPATVEVYFRSSSGKSNKIEKKAIRATLFPPPKINLKA